MSRAVITVGEYLAKPSRSGHVGRAADCCAALSACSWSAALALALLSATWGGAKGFGLPGIPWSMHCPFILGLVVAGALLLAGSFALRALDSLGVVSSRDDLGSVKRAALNMMLAHPRFGISRETPMEGVGLSVRYLSRGAGRGGARCRNRCAPYMPEDLRGCSAADFGGIDLMCVGGDLLVFFTVDAKRGFMRAMNKRKGGGRR